MSKVNRKATKEDKKQALNKLNNSDLGIKGNLSPKQVKLLLEYVSQGGHLKRSTKAKAKAAEAKACHLWNTTNAKAADALHIFTPAVNTLQNEYISQQKGSNIIAQVLLNHGYKDADFQKAAKQVRVAYKRGIKREIKAYEKQYTTSHSSKKSKSKKNSKVINLDSAKAKRNSKKIKRAKKSDK